MNKWKSYSSVVLLLSIAISIIVNPTMPESMASHWNLQGQIDGYLPRFWALSFAPFLIFIFIALFTILPKLDPLLKNSIEKQEVEVSLGKFIFILTLFLFYIHLLSISINLDIVYSWGLNLNVGQLIMPAMGILFFFIGILLRNIRRNWFIGFRTPWTIASDKIWRKTHKIVGFLFIVTGALVAFSFFWPDIAVWILAVSIIVDVFVPIFYSLYLYLQTK